MANINSNRWLVSRRRMLRGMGAAIALPFLDCMNRLSRADAHRTELDDGIRRSVFIYVPNGVNTLAWQIQQAGRDYRFTEPLKSLEPFRDSITPISGLHHPGAIGKAHRCDQIWLTGAGMSKHPANFRNTVSADQVMAEAIGQETRFPSLELTVTGGTLAWNRNGVPLPAQRKPSQVFERLFTTKTTNRAAEKSRLRRRASVLDMVLEDARDFRKSIGKNDQSRLDDYLQSVREVERRTTRADQWLDTPRPHVDPKIAQKLNRNIPDAKAGDYYRTLYDLMVLVIRTDMTRVMTCMSGSESHALALPEIGINQSRHELSHHNGDQKQLQRLTQCDTFLVEQFAYFLGQLKRYQEDGESLLDRTAILFGSGMSYGHSHGNANLPLLLAGGRAMGYQHGEHVDFNLPKINSYQLDNAKRHYQLCMNPVDSEARLSNLLLTMVQRMGVPTKSFADSTSAIL